MTTKLNLTEQVNQLIANAYTTHCMEKGEVLYSSDEDEFDKIKESVNKAYRQYDKKPVEFEISSPLLASIDESASGLGVPSRYLFATLIPFRADGDGHQLSHFHCFLSGMSNYYAFYINSDELVKRLNKKYLSYADIAAYITDVMYGEEFVMTRSFTEDGNW